MSQAFAVSSAGWLLEAVASAAVGSTTGVSAPGVSVVRLESGEPSDQVMGSAAGHSGGVALAAIIAGVAVALAVSGRPGPRRLVTRPVGLSARLPSLLRYSGAAELDQAAVPPSMRRLHRWAGALVAGALLLLIGLPWGAPVAMAAFIAAPIALGRMQPRAARQRSARVIADLPLVVDLLAACLSAGRPPDEAVLTVAGSIGGPLADRLTEVGRRLRLGADPSDAWSCLTSEPACAGFARAVQRALRSGAPLARTLENLANDARSDRRWNAEEQARAVEARSVVPLGLCFLPAFVLIGIVPTIAGSLSGLLTVVGG